MNQLIQKTSSPRKNQGDNYRLDAHTSLSNLQIFIRSTHRKIRIIRHITTQSEAPKEINSQHENQEYIVKPLVSKQLWCKL